MAAPISLFGDGPTVIVGSTIARGAIGGTDEMPVLRDLGSSPVELRQGSDETRYNAGFAYTARVSTNDDKGHTLFRSTRAAGASDWRQLVVRPLRQSSEVVGSLSLRASLLCFAPLR